MFELLPVTGQQGDGIDWVGAGVESVPARSYRLIYLSGATVANGRMIGVQEFQLLDASNRNLCRTAGFVPALGYTKALTEGPWFDAVNHGPEKTIDGNTSDWRSTCYGMPNVQRNAFIQYTFQGDFRPNRWICKIEASYNPTPGGILLYRLNRAGEWVDVTGTPSPSGGWAAGSSKTFTMPAFVD